MANQITFEARSGMLDWLGATEEFINLLNAYSSTLAHKRCLLPAIFILNAISYLYRLEMDSYDQTCRKIPDKLTAPLQGLGESAS